MGDEAEDADNLNHDGHMPAFEDDDEDDFFSDDDDL
jgi:hypothetical protein